MTAAEMLKFLPADFMRSCNQPLTNYEQKILLQSGRKCGRAREFGNLDHIAA